MKPRTVITAVLLLFVMASVSVLIVNEVRGRGPTAAAPPDGTVAYYFFFPPGCPACNAIEAQAREVVENDFRDEVAAGRLHWQAVDISEPPNRHFWTDYDLTTKSVVLVEVRGGRPARWKDLDRVWDLVDDREAYRTYVRDEVRAFIEATP